MRLEKCQILTRLSKRQDATFSLLHMNHLHNLHVEEIFFSFPELYSIRWGWMCELPCKLMYWCEDPKKILKAILKGLGQERYPKTITIFETQQDLQIYWCNSFLLYFFKISVLMDLLHSILLLLRKILKIFTQCAKFTITL